MKNWIVLLSIFVWVNFGRAFSDTRDYPQKGAIVIVMTVDWEGSYLTDKNLKAFQNFRKKYPDIPMLQFLNAAYYTKPGANPQKITRDINSVLRPHDEHGLHVHAWKTLIEASGVTFKREPDLSDGDGPGYCAWDCGHTISLEAYSADEMTKIIRKSIQILTKHGFKRPTSFRSGAWQTGVNVKQALSNEGFYLDSSATVPDFVAPSWGNDSGLVKSITKLWPNMTVTKQPYLMRINPRPVWQLPNNGSLADYTSADALLKIIKQNVDALIKYPKPSQWVVIGFHTETAAKYLPRIEAAIEKIIKYGKNKKVPIEFGHFPLTLRENF